MSQLPQHALSAAFPAMSPEDLSALTDDIATHGLRQPVVTYQGAVLDGWHRYQACLHAEEPVKFVEYDGDNPVAFVLSLNMSRRHLSASQRAAAAVACSVWKPQGRQAVESKPAPGAGLTDAEMAKAADVSERTIRQAKTAERVGLGAAMRDGKVSGKKVEAIAKLSPKERSEAVAAPNDWEPKERKSETTPEQEAELDDASERMADLAADFEAALRIIEADDKLAEAHLIIKEQQAKYTQLEKLYNAQRRELAEMTKAAKRWQRKAEGKAA